MPKRRPGILFIPPMFTLLSFDLVPKVEMHSISNEA